MHEFSLAQGLHDQLISLVREHEMKTIRMAEICVGDEAGIVVESFEFGLSVLKEQHQSTRATEFKIRRDKGKDLILERVELE